MSKENFIKTPIVELSVGEHNIVHMKFEKNVKINLEGSKDIYQKRTLLNVPDQKQLLLVDIRTDPKPNREARMFADSEEVNSITLAMAMIVSGPFSKILGNFFLGLNKGNFPTRLFTSQENAIQWLLNVKSGRT